MRLYKVVHIPHAERNPYQKLLGDNLKALGIEIIITRTRALRFLDFTILDILLKYWRPCIIHLHWHHPFLVVGTSRLKTIIKSLFFFSQLIALKIFRIKIVWTVHNLETHEKAHHNLEKHFAAILARFSDIIIVHCQTAKYEIKKAFSLTEDTKILTIPHGNYIGYHPNTVSQAIARHRLGFSDPELVFLFLGEIRYYKGVLELIDAFNLLDCEKSHLVIAGKPYDNQIAEEIQNKAKENRRIHVILHLIPSEELQIYINASDVMVFPYRDVLTSGSILLGMSFGKAIIAPMLGCIIDTLDYSGSILYDLGEQEGLLKAMRKATALNGQLHRMGKHNLDLAKRLPWTHIAKANYDAYKRCLE